MRAAAGVETPEPARNVGQLTLPSQRQSVLSTIAAGTRTGKSKTGPASSSHNRP
jgi:hypothetical protein